MIAIIRITPNIYNVISVAPSETRASKRRIFRKTMQSQTVRPNITRTKKKNRDNVTVKSPNLKNAAQSNKQIAQTVL